MSESTTVTRGSAVRLEHVSKGYRQGTARVPALDDVSIEFEPGRLTAIMGPSGSGKTTLLTCAAGLDRPDQGRVRIGAIDVTGLRDRQLTRLRREHVGFVFQSLNLLPSLTAAQNVMLPLRLAGRRCSRKAARAAVAQVGLENRAGARPAELSGGQQQRVAIARALMTEPTVVFADEPTGALDSGTARGVLELLRSLVDTMGRTVVTVTHDPVVAAWADRVVFLSNGMLMDDMSGPDAETVARRMTRLTR